MPGLIDVFLVAAIVILAPIEAVAGRRRLMRAIAADDPNARLKAYSRAIANQWVIAAGLVAMALVRGLGPESFGFVPPTGRWWPLAAGIATAITALFFVQMRAAQTQPAVAAQVREAAESLRYMLPATEAEVRRFTWVGITAGIVEELVFRGYLVWSLAVIVPPGVTIVLAAIVFGIGHAYQGVAGMIKTGVMGLVFGLLYVLSGSIWLPMFVHAAIDVLQGKMVYAALRQANPHPAR